MYSTKHDDMCGMAVTCACACMCMHVACRGRHASARGTHLRHLCRSPNVPQGVNYCTPPGSASIRTHRSRTTRTRAPRARPWMHPRARTCAHRRNSCAILCVRGGTPSLRWEDHPLHGRPFHLHQSFDLPKPRATTRRTLFVRRCRHIASCATVTRQAGSARHRVGRGCFATAAPHVARLAPSRKITDFL